jgi:hypothetical protein
MPLYSGEQELLQLTKFSTLFHSKFEMPPNMKVVSLEKVPEDAAKVPEDVQRHKGLSRV